MKYTCSMETVQQNGRFTLFSSKFLSIYSILYVYMFSTSHRSRLDCCNAKVESNFHDLSTSKCPLIFFSLSLYLANLQMSLAWKLATLGLLVVTFISWKQIPFARQVLNKQEGSLWTRRFFMKKKVLYIQEGSLWTRRIIKIYFVFLLP